MNDEVREGMFSMRSGEMRQGEILQGEARQGVVTQQGSERQGEAGGVKGSRMGGESVIPSILLVGASLGLLSATPPPSTPAEKGGE